MATTKQVTEPATPATAAATEPAKADRVFDPRKKVAVYDKKTGTKHPTTVPETWLDGRFPQISETPSSKKAGA